MDTITATKAGNWSDTTVWDLGRVPAAGDDVALAGYVITWDTAQTRIPATGTLTSITSTGTAGQIAIALDDAAFHDGASLYATTITAGTKPATGGLLLVTGTTDHVLTITADNMNAGSNTSASVVNNAGTGTVNCVGTVNASATAAYGAYNSSTGTMTVTTATGGGGTNAYGAINASTGSMTITTATGGSGTNAFGAYNVSTGTMTITTAAGGSGNPAHGAYNAAGGTLNCDLAIGGDGGPGGSSAYMNAGVLGSSTSGAVTTVKRIQYGAYGASPTAGSVKLIDDATNTAQFQTTYGGATKTLTDPAVTADFPAVSNVRKDIKYGNNNYTGTCAVPSANSVAYGVPIDDTTGIAVLTGVPQTGDVYGELPANFKDMVITNATGLIDVNDKTGFSLSNAGVDAIADEPYDNDGADISLRESIRIILAVLSGLSTGGGTNTISFRDLLNTKNRVRVTVDANGNRTVIITRDGT